MKNRSKLKEALRPIVKEALSDYLKDSEEETRALQAAHPQLDISSDLPSETGNGDNVTKGVRTEGRLPNGITYDASHDDKGRTVFVYGWPENVDVYEDFHGLYYCDGIESQGPGSYIFHNVYPEERTKFFKKMGQLKVKKLKEASTTAGSPDMGYQTPYAFSNVGLDRDVKKRKIAQQLGMKIVKKESLKEEMRVNIAIAVPLTEGFTPRLIGSEARALYDKISYYMMIASDPQYQTIHKFRRAIDKLKNPVDKKQMIQYFNEEFRIRNDKSAWEYYKDPF